MTNAAYATALRQLSAERIADAAVGALRTEALLTPKPGLVDASGQHSHPDMNLALLAASAEALRDPLRECADAARSCASRPGVWCHRTRRRAPHAEHNRWRQHPPRALWALGLLAAGAVAENTADAVALAHLAHSARPCPHHPSTVARRARRLRYGAAGASRSTDGFPHIVDHGLPMLRSCRQRGESTDAAAPTH
jgi:triphosphoribosyl-dephospho-CoA synthase